ncbi:hypothetical protein TRFO_26971 [Tritrichomonas foetus]|uniref:DnaK protein n=1 Tax=Tritrichomonas foetus TaxID=1144522 RepID=A0A1J4K6F3_9EUKA|nr:hypothetical protein TRFO_26971 [Tritrichomonas foetus]|eukprot:OHT05286.1 hypothetical protein TRFO_26971 [Tritrichomonas foetus]
MCFSFIALFAFLCFSQSAVIGIDCGSYFTKSATAQPFELPTVGLYHQSKRVTPSFLGFRAKPAFNFQLKSSIAGEETELLTPEFGERALTVMDVRPWMGSGYFSTFAGLNSKKIEEDLHINLTAARVKYNDLVALYLNYYIKSITEGQNIEEVALVFPATFTLDQRMVFENGLKTIGYTNFSSIDDAEAISYAYSLEKIAKFTKSANKVLFVDIGATTVKAYIVKFELSSKKPKATRLSYHIKHEVGGAFITHDIVDFMVKKIGLEKVTVAERQRLFTAAEKIKSQLTLLQEAQAIVENVEGRDFSFKMTREELEQLSSISNLKNSISEIISEALKISKYDEIELMGGTSRIPIIQTHLQSLVRKQIGHSMNGDEVIAMGAGYYAQYRQNQSKYQPIQLVNNYPLYSVNVIGNNQVLEVCVKGKKCKNELTLIGNTSQIQLQVITSDLQPGIITPTQIYEIKPIPSGSIHLVFEHSPTRIVLAELCDKEKCRETDLILKNGPSISEEIVKLFIDVQAREERIAKTKNEIEQFALRVLQEVEKNATVRFFSNHTQRLNIIRTAEKMKDWVRSKEAAECHNLMNFTQRLSAVKRAIGPVYVRIHENTSFYESVESIGMVMNFMSQAVEQFSAQAPALDKSMIFAFKDKVQKTSAWLEQSIRKNQQSTPWYPLPVRPKQVKEREVELNNLFKKIQNALSRAPVDPDARANRLAALEKEKEKMMQKMEKENIKNPFKEL